MVVVGLNLPHFVLEDVIAELKDRSVPKVCCFKPVMQWVLLLGQLKILLFREK